MTASPQASPALHGVRHRGRDRRGAVPVVRAVAGPAARRRQVLGRSGLWMLGGVLLASTWSCC